MPCIGCPKAACQCNETGIRDIYAVGQDDKTGSSRLVASCQGNKSGICSVEAVGKCDDADIRSVEGPSQGGETGICRVDAIGLSRVSKKVQSVFDPSIP